MEKSDIIELVVLVIIALTLAFGFSAGLNMVLRTDYPNIAVETRSMTPTYYGYKDFDSDPEFPFPAHWLRGDLLIVQNVSYDNLAIGDVIVFDVNGIDIPVVHRIVAVKDENGIRSFLTKGDDNSISDSSRFRWISQDNVHGKIIIRIPHIGWISLQILSPEGKLVLVLIAAALLILSFGDEEEEKEEDESSDTEISPAETSDESNLPDTNTSTVKVDDQERPDENIHESSNSESRDIRSRIRYSIERRLTKQYWQSMVKPSVIVPIAIIVVILSAFTFSAVINFASGNCNVQLVSRAGETPADEWSDISSNTSGMEKWTSNIPGYSIYAYNVKLKVTSRGFFNWISSLDVATTGDNLSNDQGDNLYRWTIVYDFHGTKTINAMLKMSVPDNVTVHYIQVNIDFKTSGLLHQRSFPIIYNITLNLQ